MLYFTTTIASNFSLASTKYPITTIYSLISTFFLTIIVSLRLLLYVPAITFPLTLSPFSLFFPFRFTPSLSSLTVIRLFYYYRLVAPVSTRCCLPPPSLRHHHHHHYPFPIFFLYASFSSHFLHNNLVPSLLSFLFKGWFYHVNSIIIILLSPLPFHLLSLTFFS